MFPCFFAKRMLGFHGIGGCGALNLSSPIGGAANGMPRNFLTDLNGLDEFGYEATRPSIFPDFVDTVTARITGIRGKNAKKMNNIVTSVENRLLFRVFADNRFTANESANDQYPP